MDPNIRDESTNRRREEALARRLGEALDRVTPVGIEPCPDAESIAAYHERALSPEEAAGCETHFATCSRCRKILAVLAASDDAPLAEKEVARLGELVAAASLPQVAAAPATKAARPTRADWRMRWLAPALGVAAGLAIWFAIRPPWRALNRGSSGTLIAQAPKNEPPPPAELPPANQALQGARAKNDETSSATPSEIPKEKAANKIEGTKPPAEAFAKKDSGNQSAADEASPSAQATEGVFGNATNAPAGAGGGVSGGLPAPPQPLPAPVRRPLAQAQPGQGGAPSAPEAPASAGQSVAAGAAPAINSTSSSLGGLVDENKTANLPLNGRNYTDLSVSTATRENTVLLRGPGTSLWRAGKGGSIERSTDAGKTWHPQPSPLHDDWLAGAAVSDTVCWLAGRNGAIIRTTNGKRWKRIVAPAQAAASGKLPDWIAITASDAQTATITASDQRRYTTEDGGKTWRTQ